MNEIINEITTVVSNNQSAKVGVPATFDFCGNLLMSTKEISKLLKKRHDNIMRDTRKMFADLGLLKKEDTYIDEQNHQKYPCYMLTKQESLLLVSGYSTQLRSYIIQRWDELEREKMFGNWHIPRNMSEALRLAADLSEKVEQQAQQLEEQAPKVEMAEELLSCGKNITIGDFAKMTYPVLGFGRNNMFALLRGEGVLNTENRPYQRYIKEGVMALKETVWVHPFTGEKSINFQPLITPKGQEYFLNKLKKIKGIE